MGRDVVAEQLHRDHRDQGAEQLIELGHRQQQVEEGRVRSFRGHPDQLGIAGLGLLGIAEHLVEHRAGHRDRDDGHPGIEQGDRTMLHLPGRITLGVDVADLLQLQGPFQGDRIVDAPTEEDHVLGVAEVVSQISAALIVVLNQALQAIGQLAQAVRQGLEPLR